jgi:ATP-binding cassette subfamily F protein 3
MIVIQDVVLRRGTKVVLDHASVTLNPGEKVGLIGRNGAGKSSLFALLNKTLSEDKGDVQIPSSWVMAQVAQDMPESEESATEFVLSGDAALALANQALVDAELSEDGMQIANAHLALFDLGAHDARARAQSLILGLGFRVDQLEQSVNSFSGGWRMRLQLARALMSPSDLLLLDEPTNHLDLDALVWLESWLQRYTGTMIVISHDKEFLDAVTQVTVHLEDAKLTRYGGNYSTFEELKTQQMLLQQAAYAKQTAKIAHLQSFIDRFKAKASKAKQAQSRVKALEKMARVAPVAGAADFEFEFQAPPSLPNPMISLKSGQFGYSVEHGQKTILNEINRSVLSGQRIGVLGANGQGKSTFIKTIAKEIPLLSGSVVEGKGLRIGYFAQQELDVLSPADSALMHFVRLAKVLAPQTREQELRNYLGTFRFVNDMVTQPVGTFSGGEKARLVLAMIVWQKPNLLLLDEPTNHLDLVTREALGMALNQFEGSVLLVSHDRALLRAVCDEFWLVGRGVIEDFVGDLDDYQAYLLAESRRIKELIKAESAAKHQSPPASSSPAPSLDKAAQSAPKSSPQSAPISAPDARASAASAQAQGLSTSAQPDPISNKERRKKDAELRNQKNALNQPILREIKKIDTELSQLSAEKSQLEERLLQSIPHTELASIGKRLKELQIDIEQHENRWIELQESLQSV